MSDFVLAEIRRMLDRQKELPVESLDYAQLMRNLEVLAGSEDFYETIETWLGMAEEGIERITVIPGGKMVGEPDPEKDFADAAQVSSGTDDAPSGKAGTNADETPPEKDTNAKEYKMEDVRAALVAARRGGTNVTELLKEFGVENFSAFPAQRYGELMKRLGAES
jgi:hypothetical protein